MSDKKIDETGNDNESLVKENSQNFVPTKLDKLLGYFVGANFARHYTRQDVNYINSFSSLTFISVAMATTGSALALSTGLGIPFYLSAPPLALAFTQLDRTFVRMELVERADRGQADLENEYPDPNPLRAVKEKSFFKKFCDRYLPFSIRMAMAFCTSYVTGNVIIQEMAQPEIKAMAESAVTRHNQPYIEIKKQKEDKYTGRIQQLEKAIDDANKGILTSSIDIPPVTRLPADQDKYDRAKQAYDSFTPRLNQIQAEILQHQKRAIEEENGAKLPGRTGLPGCKDECIKARTAAQEAQNRYNSLKREQAAQQAIMDFVAAKDQQAVDRQRAFVLEGASEKKIRTDSLIVTWSQELTRMKAEKKTAFQEYDKEMKETPGFIIAEKQRGLFNDMYLFEKFQERPGGGVQAKALTYTAQTLILLFEMAAVLGAATRPLAPSEERDAEKRAHERAMRRARVRDERRDTILGDKDFDASVKKPAPQNPWGGAAPS